MPIAVPPYALAAPVFRFRNLANLAGRAPIGGAREVALACFVAARLAAECTGTVDQDGTGRAERYTGAKAWLGTLALPATIRSSASRCGELSAEGRPAAVGKEVAGLAAAAASYLDPQSRAELEALATALRS